MKKKNDFLINNLYIEEKKYIIKFFDREKGRDKRA